MIVELIDDDRMPLGLLQEGTKDPIFWLTTRDRVADVDNRLLTHSDMETLQNLVNQGVIRTAAPELKPIARVYTQVEPRPVEMSREEMAQETWETVARIKEEVERAKATTAAEHRKPHPSVRSLLARKAPNVKRELKRMAESSQATRRIFEDCLAMEQSWKARKTVVKLLREIILERADEEVSSLNPAGISGTHMTHLDEAYFNTITEEEGDEVTINLQAPELTEEEGDTIRITVTPPTLTEEEGDSIRITEKPKNRKS
jgi:hypothetical protein